MRVTCLSNITVLMRVSNFKGLEDLNKRYGVSLLKSINIGIRKRYNHGSFLVTSVTDNVQIAAVEALSNGQTILKKHVKSTKHV